MVLGRVAASIGKGLIGGVNARRGERKRRKKLTTSQAAIRRFEARKRGGTGRTPTRKPWGRQGGPRADARPTGGGRRTTRSAIARSKSRSVNTGPKRTTPKRTTSQAAIARFKEMRGRRRR